MKSGSGYTTDHQRTWRRIASICLLLSATMAVYAVASSMLRDTLLHVAQTASSEPLDMVPQIPVWVCILFWVVLAVLLLMTTYIAMLDMRFIRLQYAVEKRALLHESWDNDEFREMLKNVQVSHREESEKDKSDAHDS